MVVIVLFVEIFVAYGYYRTFFPSHSCCVGVFVEIFVSLYHLNQLIKTPPATAASRVKLSHIQGLWMK